MNDIKPSSSLQNKEADYWFKVAGTTHYQLSEALKWAKDTEQIDPYEGATAEDIHEEMIDEDDPIYETDLTECVEGISLIPEPDNKYDPNAIKVGITINGKDFFIGYVPSDWTEHVQSTLNKLKAKKQNVALTGHLIGGKYKFLDLDDHVRTKSKKLGFIVSVHTEDI